VPSADAPRPAVFLDRDGTIIADRHYLSDPQSVELVPGAAAAIAALNRARIPVIVITNQSGIGRGYFDEAAYRRTAARLDDLLAAEAAHIDVTYVCPHAPDAVNPCACRKPGLLLFRRAIEEHRLDAARSTLIGDKWRDIAPATILGGRGILVPTVETAAADREMAGREGEVVATLSDAVERVLLRLGARPLAPGP
jgi:histidinol-phosphate phosphatase family protein